MDEVAIFVQKPEMYHNGSINRRGLWLGLLVVGRRIALHGALVEQ